MAEVFTDKEMKLFHAISQAIHEYKESIDQKEELNENHLIEELVSFCTDIGYTIYKLAYSKDLEKYMKTLNMRNVVAFKLE